jgi:cellulose synthase/poly-beta-1,6-N-acetylglucosamine synthase-like glycosyltransferase
VNWPGDKLHIDIFDDSNDPEIVQIINEIVQQWCDKVSIKHRTRPDRVGYKAGNLRYHFETIQGDFVAHFDADHQMELDFLKRAMPHFFNEHGKSKDMVGCVQAPCGYYNLHQNLLT